MTTARQEVDRVVAAATLAGVEVSRALVRRRIKLLREHGKTTEDAVRALIDNPRTLHSMEPLIGRRDPTGREASLRADGDLVTAPEDYGFIPTQQFRSSDKEVAA